MTIKTPEQREHAIEAGKRLGAVLEELGHIVAPGMTTRELNERAEALIVAGGDYPSFKGYRAYGAPYAYPTGLCISVNDEVVHGIPGPRTLDAGDIVSLDLGLTHEGVVMDSAITVGVGFVHDESLRLMRATQEALEAAIDAARVGGRVGDISAAIEKVIKKAGFAPVRDLGGHGVGDTVHEEPFIANAGHAGTGEELTEGMVIALEPIATTGKAAVVLGADGWTYRTRDGSRASHHEHTLLLRPEGALVLTRRPHEGR